MLPLQRKRIENQLVKWGFFRYRIQRMDNLRLSSLYNFEISKRTNSSFCYGPYTAGETKHSRINHLLLKEFLPG